MRARVVETDEAAETPRARMLIVDDSPNVRTRSAALLLGIAREDVLHARSEHDVDTLLEIAPSVAGAVLGVELDGDPGAGLRVASRLTDYRPGLPIAMLTAQAGAEHANRVAGAGLLLFRRDGTCDELRRWVACVARADAIESAHLKRALVELAQRWVLTSRELEIVRRGLVCDPSVRTLADEFDLSVTTMSTHFKHVLSKTRTVAFRAVIDAVRTRASALSAESEAREHEQALAHVARIAELEAALAARHRKRAPRTRRTTERRARSPRVAWAEAK